MQPEPMSEALFGEVRPSDRWPEQASKSGRTGRILVLLALAAAAALALVWWFGTSKPGPLEPAAPLAGKAALPADASAAHQAAEPPAIQHPIGLGAHCDHRSAAAPGSVGRLVRAGAQRAARPRSVALADSSRRFRSPRGGNRRQSALVACCAPPVAAPAGARPVRGACRIRPGRHRSGQQSSIHDVRAAGRVDFCRARWRRFIAARTRSSSGPMSSSVIRAVISTTGWSR